MTAPQTPRLTRRIGAALSRPIFGTKVIPHDARVDPSQFPEEEFSIYCRKCDYNLRGLPDGPCPECGTPFDRGRELVVSYVLNPLGRWWRTAHGRWLIRFTVLGMIAMGLELGSSLPYWLILWRSDQTGAPPPSYGSNIAAGLRYVGYGLEVTAFLAVLCCLFLAYRGFKRIADKRRRVIAAIAPSPNR